MTLIAFADSHAPWHPHQSGRNWPPTVCVNENQISNEANHAAVLMLNRHSDLAKHVQVSEAYHCTQPCAGTGCAAYREAIRWTSRQCKGFDLAVQLHCDVGAVGGGAFCLHNGSEAAELWALAFLNGYEDLTKRVRKGRAPLEGRKYNGAYDISDAAVREAFGGKWFLVHSAPAAVIVELANVNHYRDRQWLESGRAAGIAAQAMVWATREVFSIY